MKKLFNNAIVNKVMLGMLGLMLSVIVSSAINLDGSQVLAAEGDKVVAASKDYMTVEYSADNAKTMIETSVPEQPNGYEDWLFAGWYKNTTCTSPIRTKGEANGTCYAKFVPADILSVKCQVLANTTSSSEKTNMRFTTSIDTNQYLNVGFVISRAGKNYTYETQQAYQRIEASKTAGVVFEYSPKVIDTKSEAFVTYTIKNIPNTEENRYFDTVFMAKPYWTTWDGVRVYGVTKYAAVEDSYNDVVNIPVKVAKSAEVYATSDFSVVESDNTANETLSAVRYNANENYAAVVMSGKTSLPSATKYTVTQDERVTTYIHRNLETKYSGTEKTADRTWYDVYVDENDNVTEDEFVVATNADLYGLSYIIMRDGFSFANKKIYVVADIVVNKGRAAVDGWHEVEKDGETAIKDATSYDWAKIGTATYPFEGLFDGQGHTISGVVCKKNESYLGLFGKTAYGSKVQNFQLKNSYFEYNGTSTGYVYIGSIAGWGNGSFESIKSEAIVLTSTAGKGFGGIIGYKDADGDIIDCWYAGQLSLGNAGIQGGGIVGAIRSDATVNMKYCHNGGTLTSTTTSTNGSGGLCGFMEGANSYLTVDNCLTTGSISCTNNWHGSIIGRLNGSTIEIINTYSIQTDGCLRAVRYGGGTIIYNGTTYTTDLSAAAYGVPIENLLGYDGYYNGTIALEFDTYWEPVLNGTPELKSFSTASVDIWSGKGTEKEPWMIYTKSELEALSIFTNSEYNFSGKHIKLGADITVVKGNDANDVKEKAIANGYNWIPIGKNETNKRFAGHFDGNMHTISGIYLKSEVAGQGLFGCTDTNSVLERFQLTNSYIDCSTGSGIGIGSVAGYLMGTCDTVKSDATVVSNRGNSGGMFGVAGYATSGDTTIRNCWFAGKLQLGTTTTQCGGVLGSARQKSGGYLVSITGCLNTGEITGSNGQIGGICGIWQSGDTDTLIISNCLNAKNIDCTLSNTGGILGRIVSATATYTISNCYAIKESDDDIVKLVGKENNPDVQFTPNRSEVQGINAWYSNLLSGLDYNNFWCLVDGTTPQLRSFTDENMILATLPGEGTESNPWVISTKEDMVLFADIAQDFNFSGKYVSIGTKEEAGTLTITINEGSTVDEVKENAVAEGGTGNWTPIGSSTMPFAGVFNGNNNTISGIYYKGSDSNVGLFGYIANSSTIQNLVLSKTCYFENESTDDNRYMGSVIGYAQGSLDTIKSEATVVSRGQKNGGIVGGIYLGGQPVEGDKPIKFSNVWFAGRLETPVGNGRKSGGIVGSVYGPNRDIILEHCLVTGTIKVTRPTSFAESGGIIGYAWSYKTLCISDSLVASVIQNVNSDTGAIIGKVNGTTEYTLQNVYGVDGIASDEVTYEHGITGSTSGTMSADSVNYGVLDIEDAKGTDAWYNNTLTLDFDNYWVLVEDGTPELKSFSTNGVDIWSGKGTQASPWIISDQDELELLPTLAKNYNFNGKHIQLGSDEQAGELTIAVNEGTIDEIKEQKPENWKPIGTNANGKRFAGTFNGNGNTISGLYYSGSGNGIGLFGAIDKNATVQNLKLTNSYFEYTPTSGNAYIGSVAGFGFGTFTNVKSTAEVVCESAYAGGLVGGLGGYGEAYFNDCWFDGTLRVGKQAKYCGGILGGNNHPVHMQNCLNTGTILINKFNGSSISVGGICGYVNSDMEITNCLNAKSITMNRGYVSAILGEIKSGTTTLTNAYAVVGDGADQSYNGCEYYGHKADAATVTVTDNSWAKLTNEQLRGKNAITYASGLFGADTHWVTGDLYPVLNMAGEVYPSIPAMSISNESNTSTKLTGDGNFVTTVTGTTKENYDDYLTSVVAAQFVQVADNTIDNSVYSTTFSRDGLVLCVTYFAKQNQTSISYYEGAVSEHLVYNADDVAGNAENAKTTMSMMELFAYGNSFVIQLKNGHFLISDGGMEYEIEYLLDYLDAHTPDDEIPVVEGWFITHAHEDHCGAINAFYDREDLVSRVHVEGVYYSSPNDENVLKNAGGGESKDYVLTRVVRGVLRNSKGEPTAFYRPQTGQRYYFNDTTIDILLAQEQLSVDETEANIRYRGNLNSSSTVCLFTSENQTCLLSGDLEETGFDWLFGNYNETIFSTLDFFTLNHHGFNTSETIANKITASTILLTLKDNYDDRCAEHIEVLIGKAKESMTWGNGTVVFTFPHTAGNNSYQRLAPNTWKYHEGVDRPVQENIDGTLQ